VHDLALAVSYLQQGSIVACSSHGPFTTVLYSRLTPENWCCQMPTMTSAWISCIEYLKCFLTMLP